MQPHEKKTKNPKWLTRIIGEELHNIKQYRNFHHILREMLYVDIRDILKDSCYYYCSGSDISPIVAFKNSIHSYIYCDIGLYSISYYDMLAKLKTNLNEEGFNEIQSITIDRDYLNSNERIYRIPPPRYCPHIFKADWSLWSHGEQQYSIIFIFWDDSYIWELLYSKNNIRPKAICRWRPEGSWGFEVKEELEPEFWIDHKKPTDDYILISETIKYFGEYGDNYMNLFQKKDKEVGI
ncbi:MAG: hypothetical protein IPH57_10010 [Saprospiraceae bacterium]|nr:hypothetical protein [Saprospiraceae bacterium]